MHRHDAVVPVWAVPKSGPIAAFCIHRPVFLVFDDTGRRNIRASGPARKPVPVARRATALTEHLPAAPGGGMMVNG
jgi:hypothetical protein